MPLTSPNTTSQFTVSSAAQALAVGSTVGAVTSVIFNMIRFQRWGLSFTDIATTSDIVMSGITVGLALIKIAFVIVIGAVISEAVMTVISWVIKRVANRNREDAERISAILTLGILAIITISFVLIEWRVEAEVSSISLRVALVAGLISGALINLLLFSRHKHFVIKDKYFRFVPAIWIVVAATVGVKLQMQQIEENPLRLITANNFCIGAPVVVWVGNTSVVSRCATSSETFTYIVTERSAGILGRRRAITRFIRDARTARYRSILNRREADWRQVPHTPIQFYVDRSSIVIDHGEAQFIAVYFPGNGPSGRNLWPGTKLHISDQTVQCLFPYSDRLISLIAYSRSDRRIRLDETDEDRRYDNSISIWRYQISHFVCERSGSGVAIAAPLRLMIDNIMNEDATD